MFYLLIPLFSGIRMKAQGKVNLGKPQGENNIMATEESTPKLHEVQSMYVYAYSPKNEK